VGGWVLFIGKGIDLAPSKRASMAGATDPYPVLTVLFVCCTRKINCECIIQLAISACSQRQRGYRADIACILPKQASKCISSCVQLTSSSHGIIKPTRHHIYSAIALQDVLHGSFLFSKTDSHFLCELYSLQLHLCMSSCIGLLLCSPTVLSRFGHVTSSCFKPRHKKDCIHISLHSSSGRPS